MWIRYRRKIAAWLHMVATWVDVPVPVVPTPEDPLLAMARIVIEQVERKDLHPRITHTKHMKSLVKMLTAQRLLEKAAPYASTTQIRAAIETSLQALS